MHTLRAPKLDRDEDLLAIAATTTLRQLTLAGAEWPNKSLLSTLGTLPLLSALWLDRSPSVSNAALAEFVAARERTGSPVGLTTLSLLGCRWNVTGEVFSSLARLQLRGLAVSGITACNPRNSCELTQLAPTLELLGAHGCLNLLSGEGVSLIAALSNLQDLSVGNTNLTDSCVARLTSLTKLRVLRLNGCNNLTPKCAPSLAALTALRMLSLSSWYVRGCRNVASMVFLCFVSI